MRYQVTQQQLPQQQQSHPPPIAISPLHTTPNNNNKQKSRPSPTSPQTPTMAVSVSVAEHVTSSAVIIKNPMDPTTTKAAVDTATSDDEVMSDQNATTSTLANSPGFGK